MQMSCCTEQDMGLFERLKVLESSASTLVLLVHFLVSRMVSGCALPDGEIAIQTRLMLRSLAEDGEFARLLLRKVASDWTPKIEECVRAAVKAGEAVGGPVLPNLRAWFTHNLAAMIVLNLLPATPVVDYGVSRARLVKPTVWFALRGMGLNESAIKRYYNRRPSHASANNFSYHPASSTLGGRLHEIFVASPLPGAVCRFICRPGRLWPAAADEAVPPPPAVTVSLPVAAAVTDYNYFTGRTEAVESVQVRAHAWGYLDKINFKEGTEVKKGDVLIKIDPRTYNAALAQRRPTSSKRRPTASA